MVTPTTDPHIVESIEAVLEHLRLILPSLMLSGENWQVALHGGRNGDVIVEKISKATVVRRPAGR